MSKSLLIVALLGILFSSFADGWIENPKGGEFGKIIKMEVFDQKDYSFRVTVWFEHLEESEGVIYEGDCSSEKAFTSLLATLLTLKTNGTSIKKVYIKGTTRNKIAGVYF